MSNQVGGEVAELEQNRVSDPEPVSEGDLLPVRMLNEYAYCPRLFHFMHVEQRFADNHFTVEGRTAHRRVDELDHVLPDADVPPRRRAASGAVTESGATSGSPQHVTGNDRAEDDPPVVSRSVPLASTVLGITAKLDLVSSDASHAVPVETKRGRVPDNPERSHEPERVQLMAQGLLLREAGYQCDHGVLYFAESRTRVAVHFTPELEQHTLELIPAARRATTLRVLPDPLEDSPKCYGCSLNAICLPDETLALKHCPPDPIAEPTIDGKPIRRLYPVRDEATPLYVQEPGARIGTSRGSIVITKENIKLATARLQDTSQLVICGNVGISAQTIQILAEAQIPIAHLSGGHWFYAVTHGLGLKNAFDRAAQFDAARDPARCLQLAKQLVIDKAINQRTLLRRNASPDPELQRAISDIDELILQVPTAPELPALLGYEGSIAARYFSQFAKLLKPRDFDATWDFNTRNRRPPKDPVNALLSFGYAMLVKEFTVALLVEGLDPYWG
ncbi:MAG TPA: CRISPR-associated endonuclease Cas1, partial [Tepidisphaeraceae bacterium]|nr:CRISPR-associated endonuclease Cas1 [Tepidisphaeraceae bacterium]